MTEEMKERYAYLKNKQQERAKISAWQNNELFMECVQKISNAVILSEEQCKSLFKGLSNAIPLNAAGHIKWNELECHKNTIKYNQLKDYIDIIKSCYVVWVDYELPVIKCNLQSIIDNADDFEAVSFSYIVISEDYEFVFESVKSGFVNLGVFND